MTTRACRIQLRPAAPARLALACAKLGRTPEGFLQEIIEDALLHAMPSKQPSIAPIREKAA